MLIELELPVVAPNQRLLKDLKSDIIVVNPLFLSLDQS